MLDRKLAQHPIPPFTQISLGPWPGHLRSSHLHALNLAKSFADLDIMPSNIIPGAADINLTVIGTGHFAKILKVEWEGGDMPIAVKQIRALRNLEQARNVGDEARVLQHVGKHRSIIDYLGALPQSFGFVTMYYDRGDLMGALEHDGHVINNNPLERAIVFLDLAEALAHLKTKGVLHRDIRPENVYLKADGGAVLGDFDKGFVVKRDEDGAPKWPNEEEIFMCSYFRLVK